MFIYENVIVSNKYNNNKFNVIFYKFNVILLFNVFVDNN